MKSLAADGTRAQACPSAQPMHADVCEPKTAWTGELVESCQPAPQADGMCSPAGYTATPPLPSAPYWALHNQPRGASNRMSPWLSVYTASSPPRLAGALTVSDAGCAFGAGGGVIPKVVWHMITGTTAAAADSVDAIGVADGAWAEVALDVALAATDELDGACVLVLEADVQADTATASANVDTSAVRQEVLRSAPSLPLVPGASSPLRQTLVNISTPSQVSAIVTSQDVDEDRLVGRACQQDIQELNCLSDGAHKAQATSQSGLSWS